MSALSAVRESGGAAQASSARAPLSVVLITRNAAEQLEGCLASVPFADEIVIVDTGSDDDTLEVAERYGARVVPSEWRGFGPQKQFAVEQAEHEWVLCLDADERVSPELRASIERALAAPAASVYRMARRNRFMGRWLRYGEGYPDWSLRLFDRRTARWSDDPVHEKVLYAVSPGTLAGDLLHDSAEDLGRYLEKQNRYSAIAAQQLYERGRRAGVARMLASPLLRFVKFYVFRLGFLDGVPGLVHVAVGCMNSFVKYAKLIELQRSEKTE